MKKVFCFVLMIVMLLSMTVVCATAHSGAYGGSYGEVPATETAPVIDGVMDEVYSNSLAIPIENSLGATYNAVDPPTIASGVAYVLVSSDYQTLYVYVLVHDEDQVYSPTSDLSPEGASTDAAPWLHDGVEVFLDPSNAKECRLETNAENGNVQVVSEDTIGLYQFRMEFNGTKSSGNGNMIARADALNSIFEAAVNYFDISTYATEFAIDLSALSTYEGYTVGGKGDDIGIMFMINDILTGSSVGNNILSTELLPLAGGNSPSVWSAQEWRYITLGDTTTQSETVVDTTNPTGNVSGNGTNTNESDTTANNNNTQGESANTNASTTTNTNTNKNTATQASDGIAVAVGLLVVTCAGATMVVKKKR